MVGAARLENPAGEPYDRFPAAGVRVSSCVARQVAASGTCNRSWVGFFIDFCGASPNYIGRIRQKAHSDAAPVLRDVGVFGVTIELTRCTRPSFGVDAVLPFAR